MKAVRLHGTGDLRIENIPEPGRPATDEVLLRVDAAGICGSDLHNFHTGMWISRTPSTPGHEFTATVIEAGEAVVTLRPGDRVVADSRMPCGSCTACHRGEAYLCEAMGFVGELNDGGFAPLTLQKASQLLALPDPAIEPAIAVLAEPLAVALHAVNRTSVAPGDTAVVMGAGTIGVLCAIVLRHRGVDSVMIIDPNTARRDGVCEAFGFVAGDVLGAAANVDIVSAADSTSTASTGDAVDTAGTPKSAPGKSFPDFTEDKPTVCIDTTGAPAALISALDIVARGARIAVVGLYGQELTCDMNRVVEGGITIAGCAAFDSELSDAVELLGPLRDELSHMTTETVGIDEVPGWYAALSSPGCRVQKVIIERFE